MALTPRPERPIDSLTLSVIQEVRDAASDLGLEAFLVGATARIILLEHVFGLHTGRVSRDMDFAFAVESWDQFQSIKQRLISASSFEEMERMAQRLIYKPTGIDHKLVVDIIPFGGLEGEKNTIAWSPDMSVLMNVAGYSDAHASAVPVEVEPGLVISVASIPGIAVLKLFAWVDRGQEDPKDAIDLVSLLRQYNEAGNQERVYEDAVAALEAVGYDVELAGAWLLGHDAAVLSSPATRSQLNSLLAKSPLVEHLVTDMSRAMRARDDALDYSRALLEQFLEGFAHKSIT
ncbi:MAG: nucleotidyl transferase AbiEii/AbiGii toxin family protein [Sulfurimicrobium sp.]|nr:nucleotidyl transferase AbiEii/AbiGii toxin family protein [Sulfurimicrobium sp.]